jgi:glycosyltransferase involved in cell wall biosynthesis
MYGIMRVLLFARYSQNGSTSRVRAYQYLPYLRDKDIDVIEMSLFDDKYIKQLYANKGVNYRDLCLTYLRRLVYLVKCVSVDIVWIEKELFPGLPAWGEFALAKLGLPYVVDYDDATFHWYDKHPNKIIQYSLHRKIDIVMRRAALVIVGNDYLAARARKAGAKWIEYLPSVVDLDRYKISSNPKRDEKIFTIGWIGSPVTAQYLNAIHSALSQICNDGYTRVIIVGAAGTPLNDVPLEIRAWSEDTEVANIQSFDVGIMPLADGPWERGKCGYKLIQYMACGKPVVASPVGINRQIIEDGANGFLATTTREWVCALRVLRDNYQLRENMGQRGRIKVELEYSLQVTAPRLVSLFRSMIADRI